MIDQHSKYDFIFVLFSHDISDARLVHRQCHVLSNTNRNLKIGFLKNNKILSLTELEKLDYAEYREADKIRLQNHLKRNFVIRKFISLFHYFYMVYLIKISNARLIQVSDARELPFAVLCRLVLRIKFIYDSHEDYPRQILDLGKSSMLNRVRALGIHLIEGMFGRFAISVFCTDDFLLNKYQMLFKGEREVSLLRNFPVTPVSDISKTIEDTKKLKLVYIGSVNEFRGIIETVDLCIKYNNEYRSTGYEVSFHIYAEDNSIIQELLKKDPLVHFEGWVAFQDLKKKLTNYDVGICLWQDIPKFRRNLPLKNFDYMSAGLPIITSNFGNLKKYADESKACICINPNSYGDFSTAITKLMDKNYRSKLGNNGLNYITGVASFEREAKTYVRKILEIVSYNPT